jgi:hypothetical protein
VGGGTRSRLQKIGVFWGRAWWVGMLGFVCYGVVSSGSVFGWCSRGGPLVLVFMWGFLLGGCSWMWCGAVGVIVV